MADWSGLEKELKAWRMAGRAATFWWRDDDAKGVTEDLDRLLALRREARVPLALAVIPASAHDPLARRLAPLAEITVLQHGFAHVNHAPEGEKKVEIGGGRPADQILGELIAGREKLESLFSLKSLPALVPPWNRIEPEIVTALAERGFSGLSTWGPREAAATAGLVQVNTHIDIIDWKGERKFVGEERALDQAVEHLKARRAGAADADEPTGLLTHHLAHDRGCWKFLAEFLARTSGHSAARWLGAPRLFAQLVPADHNSALGTCSSRGARLFGSVEAA